MKIKKPNIEIFQEKIIKNLLIKLKKHFKANSHKSNVKKDHKIK